MILLAMGLILTETENPILILETTMVLPYGLIYIRII